MNRSTLLLSAGDDLGMCVGQSRKALQSIVDIVGRAVSVGLE